jgi:hypothetical protein
MRIGAALLALVLASQPTAPEPTLETVLARAAAYVADYQKRLAGIVAEEHYRQQVTNPTRTRSFREFRELRSDVLLVKLATEDRWLQFRDVFEVDRKPIRDRDQRLYKLFVDPPHDAQAQVESIQLESARYNIGPVMRTINVPILALLFFEAQNQPRLKIERGRAGNVRRFASLAAESDVWLLEFKEVAPQTMVRGDRHKDLPSNGRVWIDSRTGRILRTEHQSSDLLVRADIDVTYRAEAGLDLLIPAEMRENYLLRRTTEVRIDGIATYSKFRQFTVTTTEKPKPQ